MPRASYVVGALILAAAALPAQQSRSTRDRDDRPARVLSNVFGYDDPDRAAIGVSTSSGGMRDTLGLLVASVIQGGPADKAGVEEGNRIAAINNVNLRLSAADAGEGDMDGIANRRLIRELEKVKAGDEVELRLWAGGETRTVKVKTVAAEDLPSRSRAVRRELDERPVIGMSLSATGSRRDTLGMLVVRVTTDGPAEKAGIIEGDRIAAINGVNLRVASEDAGDSYMSQARINRYRRELGKVTVGEDVELRVLSGGQTRTVRLKPVRAGDLPRDRGGVMIIGDGAFGIGPDFIAPMVPATPIAPRGRVFELDGDVDNGFRLRLDPRARIELQRSAVEAARAAEEVRREVMERLRSLQLDRPRWSERDADGAAQAAPRAKASTRIAAGSGAGVGTGSGHAYGYATGGGQRAYAPVAAPPSTAMGYSPARTEVSGGRSVAVWTGDDPTFSLNGLTLARVNDDLAGYLGKGSEQGFLVLDPGDRWAGVRAGDVLLTVDGRAVRHGSSARIALDDSETHTAEVLRDGRRTLVALETR